MKKRLFSAMLAVMVVMVFAFAGCGKKEAAKLEGSTYALSGGETADGQKVDQEQIETLLGEISYTFKEGGVLECTAMGQTVEGTWKQDGNKVTISSEGTDVEATLDGDKLTMENQGIKIEMTRK